jgi:large subunit ribosomal protein L6
MSRIGKQPIEIPESVALTIENKTIHVKGPLGADSCTIHEGISMHQDGNILKLEKTGSHDDKILRAMHGLYRALIANIVAGVTKGFEKALEIQGVGYRVQQQGSDIQLHLGYSHPVMFKAPEGITLQVVDQTNLVIKGSSKHLVGQVAANIRKLRAPEPYKGKGIRYKGEYVRRKAGKAGKK